MIHWIRRSLLVALSAVAFLACSSSSNSGGSTVTPPPPSGSYTLSVSPGSLSITQGQAGSAAVTINRLNGFSDAVTLSVDGAPTGVVPTFAPASTTGASSTLSVAVAATAVPGPYTLTVRGSAGSMVQTATLALTVQSAVTAGFSLSLQAPTLSVTQGNTGTMAVTVNRTGGFNGTVALSLEGTPNGVTATFGPSGVTGATSTLSLAVGSGVAPGTYPLTVKGSSGSLVSTVALALTVQATGPAPGFTLALAPATLSVNQGASGSTTLTLTRTGGFSGTVDFTLEGAPSGVVGTFSPASTSANASTLTLAIGAAVPAQTLGLTIRGTSGTLTTTASLSLTINAVTPPSFALNAQATSIKQGQGGTSVITLTRAGGFTGVVDLVLDNPPAGITGSFSPSAVSGTTSTLSLNVASSVATSTYSLSVKGTSGSLTASTALSLTVTASGSGGGGVLTVTVRKNNQPGMPAWMAFQPAPGAVWQHVTDSGSNGVYSLNVTDPQGKWGLAWVEKPGANQLVNVIHYTLTELKNYTIEMDPDSSSTTKVTVSGSIAGAGLMEAVSVTVGGSSTMLMPGSTTYSLQVEPGTYDVIATRAGLGSSGFDRPNRIIVQRAQAITANTTKNLDFTAQGFTPEARTITVNGLEGAETSASSATFLSKNLSMVMLSALGGTATLPYSAIPEAQLVDGDLHLLMGSGVLTDTALGLAHYRSIYTYTKTGRDITLTLPPALSAATVAKAGTTPYVLLKSDWPALSLPSGHTDWSFFGSYSQSNGRSWDLTLSKGWVGNSGPVSYTFPGDFASHARWDAAWGLLTGQEVMASLSYISGTVLYSGDPQTQRDNYSFALASRSVKLTP